MKKSLLLAISFLSLTGFAGTKDPATMTETQREKAVEACYQGSVEAVKKLDEVWDLNHNLSYERSCLFFAIDYKNFDVALYLVNKYPESVFYQAREFGNIFWNARSLTTGLKPEKLKAAGDEVLKKVIQLWMTHPLSPASRDINYEVWKEMDYNLLNTALSFALATDYDFYPEIKKMIEAGASRYHRNNKKPYFGISHAVFINKPRLVKYFLSLGDQITFEVERAVTYKNAKMVKLLVENGGNVHYYNDFGNLYHYSIYSPNLEVLKYLVSQGVSKTHKNKEGSTPLDVARNYHFDKDEKLKKEYIRLLTP